MSNQKKPIEGKKKRRGTSGGAVSAISETATHIYNVQGDLVQGSQHKAGRDIHQSTVHHHGAASDTVNLSHQADSDLQTAIDKDPSAAQQGRRPLRWRKPGERVRERYMTPKEYQAYTARKTDGQRFWDGIERKRFRLNWEPWDWSEDEQGDDLPAVSRRFNQDRRVVEKKITGEDRREAYTLGRRTEDIQAMKIHTICVSLFSITLLILCSLAVYRYLGGF